MGKTTLWVCNGIIVSFMASFLLSFESNPRNLVSLFGAMAQALGGLSGGLGIGWIANRFMKEATDKKKNLVYFFGVLLFALSSVFSKLFS